MEFLRAAGNEVYAGDIPILLRGFGLGGWFLPEGYMWKLYKKCDRPRRMEAMIEALCGKEYAETFWKKYLDYYITEEDIRLIAEEGFNSVRLPLNARHLYEIRDGKMRLHPGMIARIDQVVDWCGRYQIYVILDMHGAPGGQTGQNIDDSEDDKPRLFLEEHYQEELVWLWRQLAARYHDSGTVAGYDLLNEPLPNWQAAYNNRMLPLYRRLIHAIREVDPNHIIILEGVHWATDFSIFEDFTREEAADNIMLQFHKYWNNPDKESIKGFMECAGRLGVPLWMGEGGENNYDWYTTAFPLYERLNIGWNFWSYKKMDCGNSPVTFAVPEGWEKIIQWLDGGMETFNKAAELTPDKAVEFIPDRVAELTSERAGSVPERIRLTPERARAIFDSFLHSIHNPEINHEVFCALKRQAPVRIPCEAYQDYDIRSPRIPGAILRMSDPVSLVLESGRTGEVDYLNHRQELTTEQNVLVQLSAGDRVGYRFLSRQEDTKVAVWAEGDGELLVSTELEEISMPVTAGKEYPIVIKSIPGREQVLWLACTSGVVKADYIGLS